MPTGYTDPVMRGEVTDLSEFAATVARGFMPFVHMRDERMDAPLRMPEKPDNSYYVRSAVESAEALRAWQWSTEEEKYAQWSEYYTKTVADNQKRIAEKREIESRYRRMLAQVHAVDVPSNVETFKKYMIDQLEDSIDFDCNTSYYEQEPEAFYVWYDRHAEYLLKAAVRAEEAMLEERKRYDGQVALIKAYAETFGFEVVD